MMRHNAILIIDTREQLPYRFEGSGSEHIDFDIRHEALPAGDYAGCLANDDDDPQTRCVIERKSHADLLSSLTHGRERFEAELEKLHNYGFAAIVIEGDLPSVARGTPNSRVNPKSIVASLIAFSQRFGVHIVFASDRRHAEAYCWRILERWCRDRADAMTDKLVEAEAAA